MELSTKFSKKSWSFALENVGCSLQARAPTLLDFVGPEFQENIDHQKHRPNSIKNGSKQLVSSSWRPGTLYAFFHSDQSEGSHTLGRSVRELPHFLPFNVRAPIRWTSKGRLAAHFGYPAATRFKKIQKPLNERNSDTR